MSFFGGGSDFVHYFEENPAAVLSTTINKYCYVTVRELPPFFNYQTHLSYSKTEQVNQVDEIVHPAVREAMRWFDLKRIRLIYDSDLPAQTGLGTSSSFAVAMLSAFYELRGEKIDVRRLADEAIYLERTLCDEAGGIQDQIAAAFGGFNRIDFSKEGYQVQPVQFAPGKKRQLGDNLLLFFTHFTRRSSDIQKDASSFLANKKSQLAEMVNLVDQAESILASSERCLSEFGHLLNHSWQLKRGLNDRISTSEIDDLYERACRAGALGGKLLGAGGGGFLLFYVEPQYQEQVCQTLKGLLQIPFNFEPAGVSTLFSDAT